MALKSVNLVSINSKIVNKLKQKQYQNFMYSAANTRFVFAKDDLLEQFDNHEVTKELKEGAKATSSEFIDHGNLASFIGLPDAEQEVAEVREFLRENTVLQNSPRITTSKNKINYKFPVKVPSKTQVYEQFPTPDNWSSRSWLQLIEDGIGNAAKYVFRLLGLPNSRSGTGLQISKNRKDGGSFKSVKYISEIIDNFRARFK